MSAYACHNESFARRIEKLDDTIRCVKRQTNQYRKLHERERNACLYHMRKGNNEKLRICAENAVRHQTAHANYDKLLTRLTSLKQFVTNAAINQNVSKELEQVVRAVNRSSHMSNPLRVMSVMDRFETMCHNVDVVDGVLNDSMKQTDAVSANKRAINEMIACVAVEHDVDPSYASEFTRAEKDIDVSAVGEEVSNSSRNALDCETILDELPDVPKMDPF